MRLGFMWKPEEQPQRSRARSHGGSRDFGPHESLLAELDDLLSQHCLQLGNYVDGRLVAHHQALLGSLTGAGPGEPRAELLAPSASRARWTSLVVPASPEAAATEADIVGLPEQDAPGAAGCESMTSLPRSSQPRSSTVSSMTAALARLPTDQLEQVEERRLTFDQSERKKRSRVKMRLPEPPDLPLTPSFRGHMAEASLRQVIRQVLQRTVGSPLFEGFTISLIISNVVFFGFEVEYLMGTPEEDIPTAFKVVESVYTGVFTVELLLRGLTDGITSFFCGPHRVWNITDLLLVLISLTEMMLGLLSGGPDAYRLEYVRIIRVARTVRIFRVIRIVKFFRPLRILVYSVMNTLRSLAWTLVLLAIIIYSFGVVFAMAASRAFSGNAGTDQHHALRKYFGSLWISIATLFKSITGGMDWQHSSEALGSVHQLWALLFVAYIAFSQLAVLNVVTGVVCQTAIESAQQDQDIVVQAQLASKQHFIKQFHALFMKFDKNRSGSITLEEFEDRLQDPHVQDYFSAMELTMDEAWSLFKLLDADETGVIDIDEFVSGCLRLRGNARSVDVHMLKYESKWTMKRLSSITRSIADLHRGHLPPSLGSVHALPIPVQRGQGERRLSDPPSKQAVTDGNGGSLTL